MKNTIQAMQDYLPEYIDREYPKGSADRGHATVHIVKFLHDFLHHTKDAHREQPITQDEDEYNYIKETHKCGKGGFNNEYNYIKETHKCGKGGCNGVLHTRNY